MDRVYVVTYWDLGKDPVVTVFDNFEAADACYKEFLKAHDGCSLDHVPVYKSFSVL